MTSIRQGTTALFYWWKNPSEAVEQELKPLNCVTIKIKLHCRDIKTVVVILVVQIETGTTCRDMAPSKW